MTKEYFFSKEIDADANQQIKQMIRRGFDDELLIDILGDFISDVSEESYEESEMHKKMQQMIFLMVQECLEEEKSWPGQTDCEKLSLVFKKMSDNGIVAKEDFTCCGTCGSSEIHDHAKDDDYGYVFYHQQDTDSVFESGKLYMGYGRVNNSNKSMSEVASEIVNYLKEAGFNVSWNGSVQTRILVQNLDWKKRVPEFRIKSVSGVIN